MKALQVRLGSLLAACAAFALASQNAQAFQARQQGESWNAYSTRLRGLSETYKKWGITLKVEPKAVFNSQAGPFPSYLKVVSGFESPDTLSVNMETGLGEQGSNAIAIAGEFKTGPDGKKVSGNGVVYLKGTGVGGKFKYDNVNGFQLEAGLEETFYSLGINLGDSDKGPFAFALKLGPAKIEVDLLKWAKRCKEVAPYAAKAGAAKVGGVMVRADVPDLAAAIAKAPEPKRERLSSVAVVSLKALARGEGTDRITTIRGIAVDKEGSDILLLGSRVSGEPSLSPEDVIVLCKAVGKAKLTPYVSIDPDPQDFTRPHRGRVGGLPGDLQHSRVAQKLLEIDYALKALVMGKVEVPGVKSIPQLIEESSSVRGAGAGRFWFVPKPLLPGDIQVERGAGLSVYWFSADPVVRTEPMDYGVAPAASGGYKALSDSMAASVTQHLAQVQARYPAIQLDTLKQIFSLTTALTILRQDPNQETVRSVVDAIASKPASVYSFSMEFQPMGTTVVKDGGMRQINVSGGVFSGATVYGNAGSVKAIGAARVKGIRSAAAKPGSKVSADSEGGFVNGTKVGGGLITSGKYGAAVFYLSKRDYRSAADEIERILQRDPTAYDALLLKMQANLYQEDWHGMLKDAGRYLKGRPKDGMGYYWQGVAQGMIGRLSDAQDSANKAVQLSPNKPEVYLFRSDCYRFANPKGSIADATKAIELSPESAFAYSIRGQAYAQAHKYHEAIADFEKALSINPMVVDDWRHLGLYQMFVDRTADAVESFTRALALDPRDPFTYFARAEVRFKQGQWQMALDDYTRCITLDPSLTDKVAPKIEECRKRIGLLMLPAILSLR